LQHEVGIPNWWAAQVVDFANRARVEFAQAIETTLLLGVARSMLNNKHRSFAKWSE